MLSNNILSTRNAPYTDFQRWAEPHLPFCIFYCLPLITQTRCGISFSSPFSMGYLSDCFEQPSIQEVVPVLGKALSCPVASTSYFLNAQCKKYIFPEITRLSGSHAKWPDPGG